MKTLKIEVLLLLIFIGYDSFSQENSKKALDTTYILGKVNWTDWQDHSNWIDFKAENYLPDSTKIEYLKDMLKKRNISFILFSATWCDDSKEQVPKIIKLLNAINYNFEKLDIFGVDRLKKEPTHTAEIMLIDRVPTLIVFENEIEIGRIIEFPQDGKKWEEAIIDILINGNK